MKLVKSYFSFIHKFLLSISIFLHSENNSFLITKEKKQQSETEKTVALHIVTETADGVLTRHVHGYHHESKGQFSRSWQTSWTATRKNCCTNNKTPLEIKLLPPTPEWRQGPEAGKLPKL